MYTSVVLSTGPWTLDVHVHCTAFVHVLVHVLTRDERRKEERSKQGQTNNKAKQHNTHVYLQLHVQMYMYIKLHVAM